MKPQAARQSPSTIRMVRENETIEVDFDMVITYSLILFSFFFSQENWTFSTATVSVIPRPLPTAAIMRPREPSLRCVANNEENPFNHKDFSITRPLFYVTDTIIDFYLLTGDLHLQRQLLQ